MKISVLVNDLSFHGLVRTYPIVKVLERSHDVEVVGPVFGDGIFAPYRDSMRYRALPVASLFWMRRPRLISELATLADGDVLYPFKPMWTSFGVALEAVKHRKRPIILDFEDLDHLYAGGSRLEKASYTVGSLATWKSKGMTRFLQSRAHKADRKTVVSEFLRQRFGGVKLAHGPDTSLFDPALYDREALRAHYGFGNKKIILFNGTINPHKGVDEIIEAVALIDNPKIQLVLAGKESKHLRRLRANHGEHFLHLGALPHQEMPGLLRAVDAMALPQRDEPYARAQVPGKVFEAMAMGLPVVATRMSDLPEILGDGGLIVPPGNVRALADALGRILTDTTTAAELSTQARARCLKHYGWDAMQGILSGVFDKL